MAGEEYGNGVNFRERLRWPWIASSLRKGHIPFDEKESSSKAGHAKIIKGQSAGVAMVIQGVRRKFFFFFLHLAPTVIQASFFCLLLVGSCMADVSEPPTSVWVPYLNLLWTYLLPLFSLPLTSADLWLKASYEISLSPLDFFWLSP